VTLLIQRETLTAEEFEPLRQPDAAKPVVRAIA
jgi:hypothetical protein